MDNSRQLKFGLIGLLCGTVIFAATAGMQSRSPSPRTLITLDAKGQPLPDLFTGLMPSHLYSLNTLQARKRVQRCRQTSGLSAKAGAFLDRVLRVQTVHAQLLCTVGGDSCQGAYWASGSANCCDGTDTDSSFYDPQQATYNSGFTQTCDCGTSCGAVYPTCTVN